jgi:hypothetical protein
MATFKDKLAAGGGLIDLDDGYGDFAPVTAPSAPSKGPATSAESAVAKRPGFRPRAALAVESQAAPPKAGPSGPPARPPSVPSAPHEPSRPSAPVTAERPVVPPTTASAPLQARATPVAEAARSNAPSSTGDRERDEARTKRHRTERKADAEAVTANLQSFVSKLKGGNVNWASKAGA